MFKRISYGLSSSTNMRRSVPIIILIAIISIIPLAACSTPATTATPVQTEATVPIETIAPLVMHAAELEIDPVVVKPGDGIVITAQVINESDTVGDYTAQLVINDVVEGEQIVTVPARETCMLRFAGTKLIPGTYCVNLDNLSGQFLVLGPSELVQTSDLEGEPSPSTPSCCGVGAASGEPGSGSSGGCGCSSVGGGCGCGG